MYWKTVNVLPLAFRSATVWGWVRVVSIPQLVCVMIKNSYQKQYTLWSLTNDISILYNYRIFHTEDKCMGSFCTVKNASSVNIYYQNICPTRYSGIFMFDAKGHEWIQVLSTTVHPTQHNEIKWVWATHNISWQRRPEMWLRNKKSTHNHKPAYNLTFNSLASVLWKTFLTVILCPWVLCDNSFMVRLSCFTLNKSCIF